MKNCENCAWYVGEGEYCFESGNHMPKDGYCDCYSEEMPYENWDWSESK